MDDACKHVSAEVSLITDAFKKDFFSRVSATMEKSRCWLVVSLVILIKILQNSLGNICGTFLFEIVIKNSFATVSLYSFCNIVNFFEIGFFFLNTITHKK